MSLASVRLTRLGLGCQVRVDPHRFRYWLVAAREDSEMGGADDSNGTFWISACAKDCRLSALSVPSATRRQRTAAHRSAVPRPAGSARYPYRQDYSPQRNGYDDEHELWSGEGPPGGRSRWAGPRHPQPQPQRRDSPGGSMRWGSYGGHDDDDYGPAARQAWHTASNGSLFT